MLISSTANPLVKRIRALRRRKERQREGAFFVDGIQPVWQALEHGAAVETLVVAPDLLTSEAARVRVDAAARAGTPVADVTSGVYEAISDRDGPAGLGAIVRMQTRGLAEIATEPDSLVVALDEIGNPGNLGSIVRTADGARAGGVVLVGDSADPFDPAAVKSSMGTIFSVDVARSGSLDELFDWAAEKGLAIVTTSARASTAHHDAPYRLPLLLVLGSEGEGLSADALARGDLQVRIEMAGAASSLNVAVAAGVLLYEIRRLTSQ